MKYKYNKENLIITFNNLAEWAENLDAKEDKKAIDDVWNELLVLMGYVQENNDDIFGTEGYESTMMYQR